MVYKIRQSHLQKRGSVYYFRITVPKAVQYVFGRREYKKSLKVEKYRQACCICGTYSFYVEKYFRLVEQMRPSNEEINLLIRNHFEKCLMDAEDRKWSIYESMKDGTATNSIESILSSLKHAYQELLSLAKSQEYGHYQIETAKELLNWQRLRLPQSSDEFDLLAKGITDAQIEAKRIEIAGYEKDHEALNIRHPLLKGCVNYFLNPDYDRFEQSQYKPYHGVCNVSLKDAVNEYLQSKVQESESWRLSHKRFLNRLTELLGTECRLLTLDKKDGIRIEEAIWRFPNQKKANIPLSEVLEGKHGEYERIKSSTADGYWHSYKLFFEWCAERDYVRSNILEDVKLKKPKSHEKDEGYRSFEPEELKAFFNSPLYTGHKAKNGKFWKEGELLSRNGNFWVPLIGLFTGLRESEILFLQINDIKKQNDIYYVDVNANSDNKSLKTRQSSRKVPVHPELIKIGFIAYWENRREKIKPTDKLFEDGITIPKKQKGNKNYSRNFAKLLGKLGLKKDERLVFHSFRNNFVDQLRRVAGDNPEIMDPLDGRKTTHKMRGSRSSYGSNFDPVELYPYVAKMDYKVDLSHLYVT